MHRSRLHLEMRKPKARPERPASLRPGDLGQERGKSNRRGLRGVRGSPSGITTCGVEAGFSDRSPLWGVGGRGRQSSVWGCWLQRLGGGLEALPPERRVELDLEGEGDLNGKDSGGVSDRESHTHTSTE